MKTTTQNIAILILSLFISSNLIAQAGSTCANPLYVTSLPFNDAGNTSTYGNNYNGSNVPTVTSGAVKNGTGNTAYLTGDEVVYSYTPTCDQEISISTTNDDSWIGLWAFTNCAFTSTVGYHTSTSGTTRSIPNLPVTAGVTYYFVISTWPSPQSTNFTINITENTTCVNDPCASKTIMSCGTTYTANLMQGSGVWDNYTGTTNNYYGSEKVWSFTALTTGSYTFNLNQGANDADFFLMDACGNMAGNLSGGYWSGLSNMTVNLTGGVTYYLIADLYNNSNNSTVTVSVTCPFSTGCENTSSYGSATAPSGSTPTTISSCQYRTEYSTINDVVAGRTYELSLECSSGGTYITVRRGTPNGQVMASGNAPLSFTAPFSGTYYIHYTTNSNCDTSTGCCTTTIECTSCSTVPVTSQDCPGATMVCTDDSFSGNSSGFGIQELNSSNRGCLSSNERESSWYYVNVGNDGTLEMTISPVAADDYDWAIWGPFTDLTANANCPPISGPIRCSYAGGSGDTGMGNGALDFSESASGDKWVAPLNVLEDQIYILLITNHSTSSNPFNLDWGGTAGLDCTPISLPVELTFFSGEKHGKINQITWQTETEINNDYFILEHSVDGLSWSTLTKMKGTGTSTVINDYSFGHRNFQKTINYYRLTQVDFDGKREEFDVIALDNSTDRKIIKRINTLGQEVNENYRGIVIEYYDDNTHSKRFQN